MKLILVDGDFIVKESRRDLDRVDNSLRIEFTLEKLHGKLVEADDDEIKNIFVVQFDKSRDEKMWKNFKDLPRDDFLKLFFEDTEKFLNFAPNEEEAREKQEDKYLEIISTLNFEGQGCRLAFWLNKKLPDCKIEFLEV